MYAVGAVDIDKVSMVLSSSSDFTEKERDVIVPLMMKGFKDGCLEANCQFKMGNVAINPWCIIGGVATTVSKDEEIIMPDNAQPGNAIILTKPLGTQLATNSFIWMQENSSTWEKLKISLTEDEIRETYKKSVDSMSQLNRFAAQLMHKYGATAATDVTGFGLYGHAENLCKFQKQKLNFYIDKLPFIKNVLEIAKILGRSEKLMKGMAVETSGGLLLCIPAENAEKYCADFEKQMGRTAWIIGKVRPGNSHYVEIAENPTIVEL